MATVTKTAKANIVLAATSVGVNDERIIDILESTGSGITWDDGSAAKSSKQLQSFLRKAFNFRGLYAEQADQFIASIVALDTGIVGTNVAPALQNQSAGKARGLAIANGMIPTVSHSADLGDFDIGDVDGSAVPDSHDRRAGRRQAHLCRATGPDRSRERHHHRRLPRRSEDGRSESKLEHSREPCDDRRWQRHLQCPQGGLAGSLRLQRGFHVEHRPSVAGGPSLGLSP